MKFIQEMSRRPKNHEMVVTVLFGSFGFGNVSFVSEEGRVQCFDKVNPWAKQMLNDIHQVAAIEGAEDIPEQFIRDFSSIFGTKTPPPRKHFKQSMSAFFGNSCLAKL